MTDAQPRLHAPHAIRDAVVGDAEVLGAVLHDWLDEMPWMPRLHDLGETVDFVRGLIGSHRVRMQAGGMGFLARRGTEVDAMYLAPGARGCGLGRALLDEAKAEGRLELWTFQANLGAQRFYMREGFREVERTDGAGNDERLPDVRLVWGA